MPVTAGLKTRGALTRFWTGCGVGTSMGSLPPRAMLRERTAKVSSCILPRGRAAFDGLAGRYWTPGGAALRALQAEAQGGVDGDPAAWRRSGDWRDFRDELGSCARRPMHRSAALAQLR